MKQNDGTPRCPRCHSENTRTQSNTRYPYFCYDCRGAFNDADLACEKRIGNGAFRAISGYAKLPVEVRQ